MGLINNQAVTKIRPGNAATAKKQFRPAGHWLLNPGDAVLPLNWAGIH